ncbi:MAG: hypothetical protein M3224_07560 [Thermoproteota archaeon]|nr:hypothetical protein [Thermoproteota archaeon]
MAGGATVIIIFGVIYLHVLTHKQLPYFVGSFSSRVNLYDETFTSAVRNISNFVPKNETLVVTSSSGVIKYFTGHPVKIPWRVNSQERLVQYMTDNNFTYLVVPVIRGNGSSVETLKPLFTEEGLRRLTFDFQRLAEFETEFSRIYLYKKFS